MLCSECSEVVKPVVAIDIDGTLGDYHGHFLDFADAYVGCGNVHNYDGSRTFKDWFCDTYRVDERTWHDIKLAYRQGAQKRSMPAYPGGARLCELVKEAGAELWLTTTRPYLRLDNVDPDTRFWLEHRAIEYDGMIYDEDKYRVLANRVGAERVCAVLDDLQEQWGWAAEVFGWHVPVQRRTYYNRGIKPYEVGAHDLEEAGQLLLRRINDWKETHG